MDEGYPYFATGEIVHDYGLLYKYWRRAGKRAEDATLANRDFNYLKSIVEESGVVRLSELLDNLTEYFLPRVEARAALEAVRDHYGVEVDADTARRMVARILAGWLIEAGKQWRILRLRGELPRD